MQEFHFIGLGGRGGYLDEEIKTCQHSKHKDTPCGSPAFRGRRYCYYHQRTLTGRAIPPDHPCRVPAPNSPRNIRALVKYALRQFKTGRITALQTTLTIDAIRLANNLLPQPLNFEALV